MASPASVCWTHASRRECYDALAVSLRKGWSGFVAFAICRYLRVPSSGSAHLTHPTCSTGHPLISLLRVLLAVQTQQPTFLTRSERLEAWLSFLAVFHASPETSELSVAPLIQTTVTAYPVFREELLLACSFGYLWDFWLHVMGVSTLVSEASNALCSLHADDRISTHTITSQKYSIELDDSHGVPGILTHDCVHCNRAADAMYVKVYAPLVLHFKYVPVWSVAQGQQPDFPETLRWEGLSYLFTAAVYHQKLADRGFVGSLCRSRGTCVFWLHTLTGCLEASFEKGRAAVRSNYTDLFYTRASW